MVFIFQQNKYTMQKGQKNYVGVDVSKTYFDASLLTVAGHQKRPMKTERFANTKDGLRLFHQWLNENGASMDGRTLLVLENTGVYHRLLWQFCCEHNTPIHYRQRHPHEVELWHRQGEKRCGRQQADL
ncbi:MAG: transposase [Flammeovirgaceae bacterium]